MLAYSEIHDYLQKNLSRDKYEHSVNVSIEAGKLAACYDYDMERAKLSGLIHDCAKDLSIDKQKQYAKKCGFFVDDLIYKIPEIIHAPASVYISKNIFGVTDIDILSAIRYHATGKENMSIIEKIIYIADIIEPGRRFDGVGKIKETAYKDLDEALLLALDSTIIYIVEKKSILHPDTIKARNFVLDSIKLG